MFVKLKSFYKGSIHQPGEIIELDDAIAKRLIAGKGACECSEDECPKKKAVKQPSRRRKAKDVELQGDD